MSVSRWLILLAAFAAPLHAEEPYDLVFRGGRIVDGSGNPWFVGDVAVRGDKIVAVGRALPTKGKREVDAKGLVVAPGFIDIHSHSDFLLLEDGNAPSKVRQGVTTEVLGEGNSAAPHRQPLNTTKPNESKGRYATLSAYFDALGRQGTAVNVAT